MTRIQADAYITAYSTLEEHVFIAPCVVTTNDNFMGRTEKRLGAARGPDDPSRRPRRWRRRPLPRCRDRRGGVRRRRCRRHEGRAAAGRRRRQPGARAARGPRRTSCSRRRRMLPGPTSARGRAGTACRRRRRRGPAGSASRSSRRESRGARAGPGGPRAAHGRHWPARSCTDSVPGRHSASERSPAVAVERCVQAPALPQVGGVDVVLIVPVVHGRRDQPRCHVPERRCDRSPASSFGLESVGCGQLAAEGAERGGDVERAPAGERVPARGAAPAARRAVGVDRRALEQRGHLLGLQLGAHREQGRRRCADLRSGKRGSFRGRNSAVPQGE